MHVPGLAAPQPVRNEPPAHVEHPTQELAPASVWYLPKAHAVQSSKPTVAANLPESQSEHVSSQAAAVMSRVFLN